MNKINNVLIETTENGFIVREDFERGPSPNCHAIVGGTWCFETFGGLTRFLKQNVRQPIKKNTYKENNN